MRIQCSAFVRALLCLLLVVALSCKPKPATTEVQFVRGEQALSPELHLEMAKTAGEHQLGLMYRKEMAENSGMFFIFPHEEQRSFWMKNTYLELDIIFIDTDLRVVSMTHRAVPLSEVGRKSKGPAKYVVEVHGGEAKKWGLKKGDVLKLSDPDVLHR